MLKTRNPSNLTFFNDAQLSCTGLYFLDLASSSICLPTRGYTKLYTRMLTTCCRGSSLAIVDQVFDSKKNSTLNRIPIPWR